MSYAERFTQSHRITFNDQTMLAQQAYGSKLRATVTEYPVSGEAAAMVEYYDKVKAKRREGRGVTIEDNASNIRRRWLTYLPTFSSGQLIDTADKFQGMQNFQSPLMKTHYNAVGRFVDEDVILNGIFGDAYEGKVPGTPITFPGAQTVGVIVQSGVGVSAVGMNLEKIKTSRKMFAQADFDLDQEEPYLLLTAQQIDDLSDEIELKSKDYVDDAGPQFSRSGKLSKVWNHWIIEYQALPSKVNTAGGGATSQRNVAYMKSCVGLGVWKDITSNAAVQPQMYNELYMWTEANMDARRLNEKGVIEIESKLT